MKIISKFNRLLLENYLLRFCLSGFSFRHILIFILNFIVQLMSDRKEALLNSVNNFWFDLLVKRKNSL